MINNLTFTGNLGGDPQHRHTPSDIPVSNFSIANTEKWTAKGGEKRERTDWLRVTAWRGLSKATEHLAKGDRVTVRGKLRQRIYEHEGQTRYEHYLEAQEIQFDRVKAFQDRQQDDQPLPAEDPYPTDGEHEDDDIPF